MPEKGGRRRQQAAEQPDQVASRLVVIKLGAQQGTQTGGASMTCILVQAGQGFLLVGRVLGLDGQLNAAILAVDVGHSLDRKSVV